MDAIPDPNKTMTNPITKALISKNPSIPFKALGTTVTQKTVNVMAVINANKANRICKVFLLLGKFLKVKNPVKTKPNEATKPRITTNKKAIITDEKPSLPKLLIMYTSEAKDKNNGNKTFPKFIMRICFLAILNTAPKIRITNATSTTARNTRAIIAYILPLGARL